MKNIKIVKKTYPSRGLTKEQKSKAVKAAKKGKDFGRKGKTFKKVQAKATKFYGSEEAGKRVAGAVFWRSVKKRALKRRK